MCCRWHWLLLCVGCFPIVEWQGLAYCLPRLHSHHMHTRRPTLPLSLQGLVDPQEHRRRGGRRGRGSALGDDEGSDGEQLGFASFRKKGTFTEEQVGLVGCVGGQMAPSCLPH